MSDNSLQQWKVSYEGKPADELTLTARTALDAVKDFAIQRPNSGADCIVTVRSAAVGAHARSFVRERGMWRQKEDVLAGSAQVGTRSSIGFTHGVGVTEAGVTITSIRLSFRDLFVLFGKMAIVSMVFSAALSLLFLLLFFFLSLLAGAAIFGNLPST